MTDGRLFDAFGTVNERRKSVQKAKASSVPVDLRERSPSTLSVDAFSTLSLGPFFRPFQAFRCPLDASSWIIPEGPSECQAEFTSKRRLKDVQNRKTLIGCIERNILSIYASIFVAENNPINSAWAASQVTEVVFFERNEIKLFSTKQTCPIIDFDNELVFASSPASDIIETLV